MDRRPFVPGLELSRRLYAEAVQPILGEHLPRLRYAAGLLGGGSDVLGFDDPRSMDHDWGPRLQIMLSPAEAVTMAGKVGQLLDRHLPIDVAGYPTRFVESPLEPGTPVMDDQTTGAGLHGVSVTSVPEFLEGALGVRDTSDLGPATWLTLPQQPLLEVTTGGVWRDDHGALTAARRDLAWYPDQVWRYLLAAGWRRIAQHEAFVGRAGEAGDDLGSQLVAVALVRDVMQLAFLLEGRYAPYEKWFGTAFGRLRISTELRGPLDRARYAADWHSREAALVDAVVLIARAQNALGLCPAVDPTPRPYFTRPFTVVATDRFADALAASITDPVVRALPRHLGAIDQYVDTTDGRHCLPMHRAVREWLQGLGVVDEGPLG